MHGGEGESARTVDRSRLRLAAARGIGPVACRRLREAGITTEDLLQMSARTIAAQLGCGAGAAEALRDGVRAVDAAAVEAACHRAAIALLDPDHPAWPPLLEALPDPPGFLWVRGDASSLASAGVAIVGSRRCSLGGRLQAERFAARLGSAGLSIVSGGARGIDASAHRGALSARAITIAVLGCGADVAYPAEHAGLYREILASGGAVISEHPPGVPPRPGHFPRRNRIIAALAVGTLVVEARERSGALVTARLTIEELGRDCWTLPARCDDLAARGSLRLLQRGESALVLDPDDIIAAVREGGHLLITGAQHAFGRSASPGGDHPSPHSEAEQRIIRWLTETGGSDLESLVRGSGLEAGHVQAMLTLMELSGTIARDPTGEICLRA